MHSAVFLGLRCLPKYIFGVFHIQMSCLFVLIFYVPVNKQKIKCHAQGQNTMLLVWLEPETPNSQVYHSHG